MIAAGLDCDSSRDMRGRTCRLRPSPSLPRVVRRASGRSRRSARGGEHACARARTRAHARRWLRDGRPTKPLVVSCAGRPGVGDTRGGALVFVKKLYFRAICMGRKKRVVAFRPTTRRRPRLGLVVRCGDLALSRKTPDCPLLCGRVKNVLVKLFWLCHRGGLFRGRCHRPLKWAIV